MIYHLVPSLGQRCGIASFSAALNEHLTNSVQVSEIKDRLKPEDSLLIEHEYSLHYKMQWDDIPKLPCRKVVIQHAFSPLVKYHSINEQLFKISDEIIYLTNKCRIEACNVDPTIASKSRVIHHYTEPLYCEPKIDIPDDYVIGIHGFAFPRNGFMRLLNAHSNRRKVFVMASISEFNKTAEIETSVYVDKIRRKIWDINQAMGEELIKLEFDYKVDKKDIATTLRDNCHILCHVSILPNEYYNASGSINVLLASGLPVFACESSATEHVPSNAMNRVRDIDQVFNITPEDVTTTADGIRKYHEENSIEEFAKKISQILA